MPNCGYVLVTNSNFIGLNCFPDIITIITAVLPTFGFSLHSPSPKTPPLILLGHYLYPFIHISFVYCQHMPLHSASLLVCAEKNYFLTPQKTDVAQELKFYIIISKMHLYMYTNGRNIRKIFRVLTPLCGDSFQKGSRAKGPVSPKTAHSGSMILNNSYFFPEV